MPLRDAPRDVPCMGQIWNFVILIQCPGGTEECRKYSSPEGAIVNVDKLANVNI